MDFKITGNETGMELVKQLASLHLFARLTFRDQDRWREERAEWEFFLEPPTSAAASRRATESIAKLDEHLLQMKFEIIAIGNYLGPLCAALDEKAPRDAILDALAVGHADRDTDSMRKYGHKTLHVIGALRLENSATKDDGIAMRPLNWCLTMAFMQAMQTNEKFDRIVHDGANEFFDGAFGEYRARPLTERLAGKAV